MESTIVVHPSGNNFQERFKLIFVNTEGQTMAEVEASNIYEPHLEIHGDVRLTRKAVTVEMIELQQPNVTETKFQANPISQDILNRNAA